MKYRFACMIGLWVLSGSLRADWLPLWPNGAPGGTNSGSVPETVNERGSIRNIAEPQYNVLLPEPSKRTGAAVVIFPGGGYSALAMNHEGFQYAAWLNDRGIAAVLVKYRVSDQPDAGYQYPVPLLDARRAIRQTRAHATEWGLAPNQIGVMGSSAGGHLASMCATMWGERFSQEGADPVDAMDCRPDFAVLVYPVIGMNAPWGHQGSKLRLLGPQADPALADAVSTHLRVDAKTPPCFLVHCADDGVVAVRNSMEFVDQCSRNKVPVVCHVFSTGGHGFGLKGKGDCSQWPPLLERWLLDHGWARASGQGG